MGPTGKVSAGGPTGKGSAGGPTGKGSAGGPTGKGSAGEADVVSWTEASKHLPGAAIV